jgi:coenzyme F420-dependent glucose-6-phosphate dehydrogenase
MAKIFYFLGHEQFQPEVLVEHAIAAEQAGFDGVAVSEHFNPWVADVGAAGFAFSTLGAIAAKTEKLELITSVVTPLFRFHPAVIAQAAATVDRLSNGRFTLGVGTGEPLNEVPLGFEYPGYAERAERMREALEIMRKLLAGEVVTFDGKFYKTRDAKLYSPPKHQVPVLLAAGGPKSVALANESADGIIVSVKNPDEATKKSETKFLAANRWTVFGQNEKDAWQALQAWRGLRAPDRDILFNPVMLQKEADILNRTDVLSKFTIVKNSEDYLAAYSPLIQKLHADIITIQTTTAGDQIELIKMLGKEVLPKLKKINS